MPAEDENEVEGCAADIECMAFDQANAGNPPPTAAGHAAEGIRFESHATGRNSREPTDPPGYLRVDDQQAPRCRGVFRDLNSPA